MLLTFAYGKNRLLKNRLPVTGKPEFVDVTNEAGIGEHSHGADVQLFENKRLLGSSQSDRIMVSAGRHEFEFVNETLGYRTARTVQVAPGKVSAIKIDFHARWVSQKLFNPKLCARFPYY